MSAGAIASALLMPGCKPWSVSNQTEPTPPQDWAREFSRLRLFGMAAHPEKNGASLLFQADFAARKVRSLGLPMKRAHQILSRDCEPGRIWVLGNESENVCRVNTEKLEIEECVKVARDGYVSSGHGIFLSVDGSESLVMSEYKPDDPSIGCLAFRSPKDLSLQRRISTEGKYPHVVSYRSRDDELIVQNLGQQAGLGEQYAPLAELVVFDRKSLKPKRRIRPGRENRKLSPGEERSGPGEENQKFLRYAGYQLDSKTTLYPERVDVVVEYPEGPSVSLWHAADSHLIRELKLPGLFPTHSYQTPLTAHILVASRGAGLFVVPKDPSKRFFSEPWIAEFKTDMHVGPVELDCRSFRQARP